MNLSDAFSKVNCSAGEAQIILGALIGNLRDSYPDLHASMSAEIAELEETTEPVSRSKTDTSHTETTHEKPTVSSR